MKLDLMKHGDEMMRETNQGAFQKDVIEKPGLVLVDFWAPWCAPCRMMNPVLEEVSKTYGEELEVLKLNVDDSPFIARQFKIQSIPCLILFQDGKPVEGAIGLRDLGYFEALLEKYRT